jgi:RES domain-containing protein
VARRSVGACRTIYRVGRAIYPLFDGNGAARYGARWTSPGRLAIYAAGSYAGALLEVLAHARRLALKVEYRCLVIEIPSDVSLREIDPKSVRGWDRPDYAKSRALGDRWLDEGESAVLCVPSVTGRPHERHYIINPVHPDAGKLVRRRAHRVIWDERLRAR